MTTQIRNWEEAVLTVLNEAQEPLHYTEIAQRVLKRGFETRTANPQAVANKTLRGLMSARGRRRVEAIENQRGWYALASVANNLNQKIRDEEAAEDDSEIIKIAAFGLFWQRDLVDWDTGKTLFGQQSKDAVKVDFADQDGLYFLHDGRREVMYIGKTFTPTARYGLFNRLKSHHDDPRKTVYWDSFSWFGFKPVSEDGQLQRTPENATFKSVVSLIEAIFIETLLPRLNQQSGEGMAQAREDGLYFQATSQSG